MTITTLPCSHPAYFMSIKLCLVHNEHLGLNQHVARIRIYCKDCQAPAFFKGEHSFSMDRPSLGEDNTVLFAPIIYPPVLKEENEDDIDTDREDDGHKIFH